MLPHFVQILLNIFFIIIEHIRKTGRGLTCFIFTVSTSCVRAQAVLKMLTLFLQHFLAKAAAVSNKKSTNWRYSSVQLSSVSN